MRVFRDVEMVEALGSGMLRIGKVYSLKRIFSFSTNFIKATIKFHSYKGVKIAQVNSTSKGKNSTRSKQEELLNYCVIPRSMAEMMHYMNMRSRRSFIISPMIKDGRLQYTIKDQPTHPKQRYIATQK